MLKIISAFNKSGSFEKLKPVSNPLKEIILTPDKCHIMADRRYFSALALSRSSTNIPEQMASKLGLKKSEVIQILEDLVLISVLEKTKDGLFVETEKAVFRTSDDFPDEMMRSRRLQNNKAIAEAIKFKTKGERGYFATVSVDKNKLDEIGPIVEDFIKRIDCFYANQAQKIFLK